MNINLTFLGQMIAFAAFVWFCMKYVWPPLIGALEERKEKIRDSLHAADVAKKDLQSLEVTMQKAKDDAKKESARIVEQARKQAQTIVDAAKQQATLEANKAKEMAQQDIDSQYEQKQEEIKHHIKQVSIALVTKIMSEQFANNAKFDDDFIAQRLHEMK